MKHLQLKRWVLALTVVMLSASLLIGCTSDKPSAESTQQETVNKEEHTIHNIWGDTKVPGTPSKVIALDFSYVDEMTALGVAPIGVAGTGQTKIPEYLADKVKDFTYVGERKEPNLEMIRAATPDLIIANPDRHKLIKNELTAIAPTISLDDKSYSEVLKNTELLGEVLGKQAEAQKVKQDLENKINDAKSKLQGRPRVLVVGAIEGDLSVWVKDSFIGSLLSDIGTDYAFIGEPGQSEGTAGVAKLTLENLASIDPDYLFVYGDLSAWKGNSLFQDMIAVQNNNVLEVDRNIWSRGRGPIAANLILDQCLPLLTGSAGK